MDTDTLRKKLKDEGFKHIYEWMDAPSTEYPLHHHQDKVSFYILTGSIAFTIDGETTQLTTGNRFDVPVGKKHTAKVGPEGCSFIVGEMIEGDS
jgi:quercetin dioxygenase-like cupin family protein